MVPVPSPRAPGRIRRILRRYRFLLLLPVVFVLMGLLYLNQVGLPGFLKRALVQELHARGLKLEFERLRLRLDQGLVGEKVVLAEAVNQEGPEVLFDEIVLEPDWFKLARLKFELRSLRLRDGSLTLPLDLLDSSVPPFRIDAAHAELRFLPDDRWELTRFTADGLGLQLRASGFLTNASAIREWTGATGRRDRTASLASWRAQLQRARAYAQHWHFGGPPRLSFQIAGDARDPAGIQANLQMEAESIESRWGTLRSLSLRAEFNRASQTPGLGLSEIAIDFERAQTAIGGVQQGQWGIRWSQAFTNLLPAEVEWQLSLHRIKSPWGEIPHVHCDVHAYPDPQDPGALVGELTATSDAILGGLARAETNRLTATVRLDPLTYLPTSGEYQLTAVNAHFEGGTARAIDLKGKMGIRDQAPDLTMGTDWAWWAALAPFELSSTGRIDQLALRGVNFDSIEFEAGWQAPHVRLSRLQVERGGEQLSMQGEIDVSTRATMAKASMTLDAHAVEPLLTPKTVEWLSQYGWDQPPRVEASARLVLPEWNQPQPNWKNDVMPTLRLHGHVTSGRATYRGLQADAVDLYFNYSNRVWHLSRLVATRPEGKLEFSYTEDTATRDYHFHVDSGIDPRILRPMVDAKAQKGFDLFDFPTAPRITGDVRGRWRAADRFGFQGELQTDRFAFRDEPIDALRASLDFTNRHFVATDVRLLTGTQTVNAAGVGLRLEDQMLFLTNVTAQVDPLRVGRAIGPKTAEILSPYQFLNPARAQVQGSVNIKETRVADLRFEVSGGPFHYWRFRLPEIEASVHWTNETVTIQELAAPFYGGQLEGQFRVNVGSVEATPFQFEARVGRADFHNLLSDIHSPTNRVEGQLSVDLAVTHANARDWNSWQGFGQAELLDGFLWDIPMVGVFSPILNTILPGIGKSRISGATATFSITNSIVYTDDLEMRAPLFRLLYRGAVDLSGRLNARVEARILRDAWLVGPVVSLIFSPLSKMLEYQVTGTLGEPHLEMLYIPKPLQAPFDPLGTLREMFREPPSQVPPSNP